MDLAAAGSGLRRRAAGHGLRIDAVVRHDGWELDVDRYELRHHGRLVEGLSARQLEIFAVLLAAPDRTWTREQLAVLTGMGTAHPRAVDVHVTRLRKRVGHDAIRTVVGRGWCAAVPREESR